MVGSGTRNAPGDLGSGEPAEEPEGEGDLGAGGDRGVTAREDQAQLVVAHGTLLIELVVPIVRFVCRLQSRRLRIAVLPGGLPPDSVDGPVAGGGDDPPRRAGWDSGGWPPLHRHREGILDRVFGDVDVTEDTDEHCHRPPVLLAEDPSDLRGSQRRRVGHQG
jgi:hypothetical protein